MLFRMILSGHPKRAVRYLVNSFALRFPRKPLRLHVGCGNQRLSGFVNIDRNAGPVADYVTDTAHLPCPNNSVERIEAYHVIEHISLPQLSVVLAEWRRVLQPGGRLVLECPDFDAAVRGYLAGAEERLYSIYGRQRFPGDAHHWGYNRLRLETLLASSGFKNVSFPPAQDYHVNLEPCIRVECSKGS